MDQESKDDLKKKVKDTELKLTKALFRWKYRREGRSMPADHDLKKNAEIFREKLHGTLSKRGKNIWQELKHACRGKGEDNQD